MSRFYLFTILLMAWFASSADAGVGVERRVFTDVSRNQVTKLEWLTDGILRFEFTQGIHRMTQDAIYASPMIMAQEFPGPGQFSVEENNSFVTPELRVSYGDGCFTAFDRTAKIQLAKVCAPDTTHEWKKLELDTSGVRNVYGLGQMFGSPGDMSSDRMGKVIATKGAFGGSMPAYAGGATGEAMFPVVMALGTESQAWGFVLDNIYKQTWDMTRSKWRIGMFGDQIRGYIIAGKDPRAVRQRFMGLAGHAPVPPRKMFGFWMSEYGYDSWAEVRSRLDSMRHDQFPIDGFFMDLQWFGNVAAGSDHTRMGTLEFDDRNFPDAESTIKSLLNNEDIGLVTIEESYIGRALSEHNAMESRGFLAHECGHPQSASYLTADVTGNTSEWWGRGGMIDWSNPDAGKYWHDTKRQNLVRIGVFAHWLDLGEPEMFDPTSCYHGVGEAGKVAHQDVHNMFSLLWAKSVWDGYAANNVSHRPFSMLRSGNIGIQRYGAGMWSGDIGGNLQSLSSHIASHNQVSWSGIDYYSSDIGGFHRNRADGRPLSYAETQENFTQWFANSTWFDVPVRSHVMNLDNDRDTAPNRIGHVESNRVNLLTRYSLIPYYYSLAHEAAKSGSPLMEPMAMRFPEDLSVRAMGGQRMLGDLMIAAAAEAGNYNRDVYLPRGLWYDFAEGTFTKSAGENLSGFPLYRDGIFRIPVFARAGAIIPRYMGTMNQRGLGQDNVSVISKNMTLDVYASDDSSRYRFEMVEDDGYSREAERGETRITSFEQQTVDLKTSLTVNGAVGQFSGAEDSRAWTIRFWSPGWKLKSVNVDGHSVNECASWVSPAQQGCFRRNKNLMVTIEVPSSDVRGARHVIVEWVIGGARSADVHFVCDEGRDSPRSHGMYIAGDDPVLGAWNPDVAIPLRAAEYARGIWTGVVRQVPAGREINWKCMRKIPGGGDRNVEWEPGANNIFETNSHGGFAGMSLSKW